MKYYVVSDVHGFYTEMIKALTEKGYFEDKAPHKLVVCGDLLDRGSEAVKCLEFINSIPNDEKILIRGNHEDLMEEAIARHAFLMHDHHNGTDATVYQVTNHPIYMNDNGQIALSIMKRNTLWNDYINSCIDFFETDKYVFVHGWIPHEYTAGVNTKYSVPKDWRKGNWEACRWYCGFDEWNKGIRLNDKTIVCGHWHTSYAHRKFENKGTEFGDEADFSPFIADGIIGLDGCTVYSGIVNCVVLED